MSFSVIEFSNSFPPVGTRHNFGSRGAGLDEHLSYTEEDAEQDQGELVRQLMDWAISFFSTITPVPKRILNFTDGDLTQIGILLINRNKPFYLQDVKLTFKNRDVIRISSRSELLIFFAGLHDELLAGLIRKKNTLCFSKIPVLPRIKAELRAQPAEPDKF